MKEHTDRETVNLNLRILTPERSTEIRGVPKTYTGLSEGGQAFIELLRPLREGS